MAFYRKKPVVVEANQWFPVKPLEGKPERVLHGVIKIPAMNVDAKERRGITYDVPARYVINTLEGQMEVGPGDWIVTGVTGERYPVKDHIFKLTYEPYFGFRFTPNEKQVVAIFMLAAAMVVAAVLWRAFQ